MSAIKPIWPDAESSSSAPAASDLDVVVRLAASGLCQLTVMDFDVVEDHNLDRLIGATRRDARLVRPKIHVARREAIAAATARNPRIDVSNYSVCEPDGLRIALDHDLIFCCVDRPWPRSILNALAYTDLIPVIDGGIAIDTFDDGTMRNATWRSHVIRPGRPCMSCNRQLDLSDVMPDKQGLRDDPVYIATADRPVQPSNQNVAPAVDLRQRRLASPVRQLQRRARRLR